MRENDLVVDIICFNLNLNILIPLYNNCNNFYIQNLSLDWCIPPEVGLPEPDAVLFLNLSNEEIAKRGSFGEERYEQTDFQKKVANNYKVLNKSWKVRFHLISPNCMKIN